MFSPKDKIGDWLEMYTKVMELNYWSSTDLPQGALSTRPAKEWTVDRRPRRRGRRAAAEAACVLAHRHVAPCPTCRTSRAWTRFEGDQHHSSSTQGREAYRGKKAVVIGSNNSAHDICAALWRARRRRHDGPALLDAHRDARTR